MSWGRRLRVDLELGGGQALTLVDWRQETPGLSVTVRIVKHLKAEPYETEVRVFNLPPNLLAVLVATSVQARWVSYQTLSVTRLGRLKVYAGSSSLSLISDDVLLRVTPEPRSPLSADHETTILANDSRALWSSLYADTLDVNDAALRTGLAVPLPLVPTSYAGPSTYRDLTALTTALGARPAVFGDAVQWVPLETTLALPPIDITGRAIAPIPALAPDGRREVSCIFDPSLMLPGQPVLLFGQSHVIEALETSLSTTDPQAWISNLSLRTLESLAA